MGTLILTGGGSADQTFLIDKEFTNLINTNKPLLYIPIAMDTNLISYESCFNWIKSVFYPLGINNITMWTESELRDKKVEDLERFSAIYIGGGNTFKLLKVFNEMKFTNVLREYIANKGIIYGGSAGAIIFGKDIRTCIHMDSNDVDLRRFIGLNVVGNYSVWCHYNPEN